jgi:hypothetical protein
MPPACGSMIAISRSCAAMIESARSALLLVLYAAATAAAGWLATVRRDIA